jgi:hypothetical protein
MINIQKYADIEQLIVDSEYAKSKFINVTHIPTKRENELKQMLLAVKSDDLNWKEKVTTLKRELSEEKNNASRYILKYDKSKLDSTNTDTLGLFRSIITDSKNIIAFSPPKSRNYDNFVNNNKDADLDFQEYAEGTMINMFYDDISEGWELSTRSNIGGKYCYYDSTKSTFRDMFLTAFTDMELEFSNFKKGYSYSFVVQHPENRIVVPFNKAQLILTNVYKIDGTTVEEMDLGNNGVWIDSEAYSKLKFPRTLDKLMDLTDNSIETINNTITTGNIDYTIVGAVISNRKTGDRLKIRNPTYEYVRQLRGNNVKLQFQYYYLRRYGRVKEFLKYYPEMSSELETYRKQLHNWTNELHGNYIKCYIKKERELKTFPFEFRTHMFELHQEYLGTLVTEGKYVSKKVVINYVNELPPAYLMASVNYPLKKINIEKSKTMVNASLNEVIH